MKQLFLLLILSVPPCLFSRKHMMMKEDEPVGMAGKDVTVTDKIAVVELKTGTVNILSEPTVIFICDPNGITN